MSAYLYLFYRNLDILKVDWRAKVLDYMAKAVGIAGGEEGQTTLQLEYDH